MVIRSVADFLAQTGDDAPRQVERDLIAACQQGDRLDLGTLPAEGPPDPTRNVRAGLIRLLALGGTPDCGLHPEGVMLRGGHVTGKLNLSFQKTWGRLALVDCRFDEAPDFAQAEIPQLSLQGSSLPGLSAQQLKVEGSLFLRGLTATGTVAVNSAKIGGQLDCTGAKLNGAGGKALNAQGVECGQSLFLRDLTATGTVFVAGAKIGGQLDCTGAKLDGAGGKALNAQGVECGQDLFLSDLTATGTVDVNGAKTGGQLACKGAKLDGAGGMALNAQGVDCGQDLFLSDLTATGTVAVTGAKIGGQLSCIGAKLHGAGGEALYAQGVDCGQSLFLRDLTATGSVDVNGAKIGGQLACEGANLDGAGGEALNAQRMTVIQGLFFRDVASVKGQVYLDGAQVGDLVDDAASWPQGEGEVYLDGFTYDRIVGLSPVTLAERRDWLRRGSRIRGRFFPQPYTQFAKVLREMGRSTEARKVVRERDQVLFAESHKENAKALAAARSGDGSDIGRAFLRYWLTRLWDWFTRVFSGYGHAPQLALYWSLGLVLFGAVWSFIAWQAGVLVPNSAVIMTSTEWLQAVAANPDAPSHLWVDTAVAAKHYETFYSLPFALDVYGPLVSLGQEEAWAATTTTVFGVVTRWFFFVFKISGWAISALGLASVTGFIQKTQPD